MADVIEKMSRERFAVRLSRDGLARVREMAEQETEGNVSLMIRKLLTEAIQRRDAQAGRK